MLNVGASELLVILLLALIVLGPEQLPDAARKIGNVVAEFRRLAGGIQGEARSVVTELTKPPVGAASDDTR
jgi:Tat protein translocase TatB subunit